MAMVARKHVPYATLRERLAESQLPWDDAAERLSIGAVLLAPQEWSRKLSVKLYSGHFYDKGHGWLWEQLAATKGNLRFDDECDWTQRLHPAFKERFLGNVSQTLGACIRDCFWWNGRWYVDRVLVAAKLRAEVIGSAERLSKALDNAERWRGEK